MTKPTNYPQAVLASLLVFALGASSPLSAQVSTPIVGFQKKTVNPGFSSASFPLLNSDLAKTTVASVSGNSITLDGVSNVGSLLATGEPYYLEVYSGALKGDRFEVNTASTIFAGNSSVSLDAASQNNTYPVANIGNSLDGATVALRKHVTLDQIRLMANPPLVGNNNPLAADQVLLFESSSFVAYSLRSDNAWRRSGESTDFAKLSIPPGTGVLINKRGSSGAEITQTGAVRQNDFALPYRAGFQFVSPPAPLDRSPADIGVAPGTNGWVGNTTNTVLADQIMVFQGETFVAYSLRNDGQLRRSGSSVNFLNEDLLRSSEAWLVKRQSPDTDNVEVQVVP